jgi:hypothetical protein
MSSEALRGASVCVSSVDGTVQQFGRETRLRPCSRPLRLPSCETGSVWPFAGDPERVSALWSYDAIPRWCDRAVLGATCR